MRCKNRYSTPRGQHVDRTLILGLLDLYESSAVPRLTDMELLVVCVRFQVTHPPRDIDVEAIENFHKLTPTAGINSRRHPLWFRPHPRRADREGEGKHRICVYRNRHDFMTRTLNRAVRKLLAVA